MPQCSAGTALLASAAFVYVIASVVYLIVTHTFGTPFKDSLTDEQRRIKAASARRRGWAFLLGIAVGLLTLPIVRPFT